MRLIMFENFNRPTALVITQGNPTGCISVSQHQETKATVGSVSGKLGTLRCKTLRGLIYFDSFESYFHILTKNVEKKSKCHNVKSGFCINLIQGFIFRDSFSVLQAAGRGV